MTTPEVPGRPARGDWVAAVVVVAVLYGLMARFFVPRFETMDDVTMAMWTSGLCMALSPTSHIIFSHEIIGGMLQHLYMLWPSAGWYGWMHAAVLFGSSAVVCHVCLRSGRWLGFLAFLAYFALTQVDAFVLMQFTKTAFYATLAGTFLLALANEGDRTDHPLLVGACALALVGSLIRPESFIFALLIGLPTLAVAWWRQDGTLAMAARCRAGGLVAFLALPLLVIAATAVIDRQGPWERYYNYRLYRSQVLDFGERIVYTDQTRPVFDDIHWTDNHLAMLRQASYFDPEIFSADHFRYLLAAFPKQWQPREAGNQLVTFARALESPPYGLVLFAGGLLLLTALQRRNAWALLVTPLTTALVLAAILLLVKWPPHRVLLPMLGSCYALMGWQSLAAAVSMPRRIWLAAACGAGLLLATGRLLPDTVATNRAFQRDSAAALAELASLSSNRSQLFFTWENNFPYAETFLPFDHHPGIFREHLQVGSWGMFNPTAEAMLQHFGAARPYEDLVNNPHLFLIARASSADIYRRFIRESYHREVELRPVASGHYLLVWSVVEQAK